MSYPEKLKDPRWQRKRLEVMQAADFACQRCGDTKSELHVHHGYYSFRLNPWEYSNDTLHCLCKRCHRCADEIREQIAEAAASLSIDQQGMLALFLESLLGVKRQKVECNQSSPSPGAATDKLKEVVSRLARTPPVEDSSGF
jgi:hypothetical protein